MYISTSLMRKHNSLGPHRRPMPRIVGGSKRVGLFLMGEILLYMHMYMSRISSAGRAASTEKDREIPAEIPASHDPKRIVRFQQES